MKTRKAERARARQNRIMDEKDICVSGKSVSFTLPPCEPRGFEPGARWLTMNTERYPEFAEVPATFFVSCERRFFAAEFAKTVVVPHGKSPVAHICVFGDTKYRLSVNGNVLGVGPAAAGGDYANTKPMPKQYYDRYDLALTDENPDESKGITLDILAEVQTPGIVQTDYSRGRGGFIFSCAVTYEDREPFVIVSDASWRARRNTRYTECHICDLTRPLPKWEKPETITDKRAPWNLTFADIPMPERETIVPVRTDVTDNIGERVTRSGFDRIYSAYVTVRVDNRSDKPAGIKVVSAEYSPSPELNHTFYITVPTGESVYTDLVMRSVGEVVAVSPEDVSVDISLIYQHYPVDRKNTGVFECSDDKLTNIWRLGRDTLEMCRQTLHLDSPLHQETLGCVGDYMIESVMTHATFGDMRLTRLDLMRISDYIRMNGGVMFHTAYSLLFPTMLLDYYRFTGDTRTVMELLPTVDTLFARFRTYMKGGVISCPPDYMFIDWARIDGFNLHHPPMALGQTALNAFYQRALTDAAELYSVSGDGKKAAVCEKKANRHRKNCRVRFYNRYLGVYGDGGSAPEYVYPPTTWLPENPEKAYHSRHANILAVWSGLITGGAADSLLRRILTEDTLDGYTDIDIQPYFMHYLLEIVRERGMFPVYGLRLIHMWDKQLNDSPKGLKEGWNEFVGDNSHAWGGTPTWQLTMAFSGFRMLEPGFARFSLSPSLLGLRYMRVAIPTPNGLIDIRMESGKETVITLPDGCEKLDDGTYSLSL